MASLIKHQDKFYLQFYDGARSPKRKQVPLHVTSRRDARRLERRLVTAYAEGEFDPWTDDPRTLKPKDQKRLTLSEAQQEFLQTRADEDLTENTLRNYEGFTRRLIAAVGDLELEALTVPILNTFIRAEHVKPSTRNSRHRYISAFLNWHVRKGNLSENPLAHEPAPKRGDRFPKTMYREDLEAICGAVEQDYREKLEAGHCKEGEIIWRAHAFRFAFYTGLRGSEIARLKWRHISRERGLIFIYRQKNRKQQTIPLHSKAASILADVPDGEPDSYVFGGPGTRSGSHSITDYRNNLSRSFKKYVRKAGIERPISLHSLRHGFCTALAEAGKSAAIIKESARHSSIETSMMYVRMSNEHLKSEMEDVF